MKGRRLPQGGDNEDIFYDWLLSEEAKGHGRVFSKLVISPGVSIGYHEHIGELGVLYILSGEAIVNDNGTEDLVMMVMSLNTLE